MKKEYLIPVLLLVLSGGIFWYIQDRKVRFKPDIINLSWSDIRKDQLIGITTSAYTNGEVFSYTVTKDQGEWGLTDPIDVAIFPEKALLLANSFLTLTPQEKITNSTPEQRESYGLLKPRIKVTGIFKKSTNSFIIGEKTSVGNQLYFADSSDSDTVYLIKEESLDAFTKGISSLINNYYLQNNTDHVITIDFRNIQGDHLFITNSDSFWVLSKPTDNPHVDWGTRKFLLSIKDIQFHPKSMRLNSTEEQRAELGINSDSPYITLLFQDGSQSSLYIGNVEKNRALPIFITPENIFAYSDISLLDKAFFTKEIDLITKK